MGVPESSIEDKTKELKGKDDSILRLEAVIQQKSDSIKSLQTDVTSLQVTESFSFLIFSSLFDYLVFLLISLIMIN